MTKNLPIMQSHVAPQSRVQTLASVNAELENDVKRLALCHKIAETRLDIEAQNLHGLLQGTLPRVITALSRNAPLPSRRSIGGRIRSRLISSTSSTPQISTMDALIESVQRFETINNGLKDAQEAARRNRVDTAHVASRAAVQTTDCETAALAVTDEQRKTSNALDTAQRNINSAEASISENQSLHNSMQVSVDHHNQEKNNYNSLWWTGIIPIVNIITVPVMIIGAEHHSKKQSECEAIQTTCASQIRIFQSEAQHARTEMQRLADVASTLQTTMTVCTSLRSSAEKLKEQSKRLTDQYSVLVSDIGAFVGALEILDAGTYGDVDKWDRYRCRALECVKTMLRDLKGSSIERREIDRLLGMADDVVREDDTGLLEW